MEETTQETTEEGFSEDLTQAVGAAEDCSGARALEEEEPEAESSEAQAQEEAGYSQEATMPN